MLLTPRNRLARLHYMANNFRVLSAGDHVLCAVTGEAIPLETLRYWSVARQEAYASADVSARAHLGQMPGRDRGLTSGHDADNADNAADGGGAA